MIPNDVEDVVDSIPGLDMNGCGRCGFWYLSLELISSLLVGADGHLEHRQDHGRAVW